MDKKYFDAAVMDLEPIINKAYRDGYAARVKSARHGEELKQ